MAIQKAKEREIAYVKNGFIYERLDKSNRYKTR